MRGGGEAAEREEGGRGMWEQERKEWEETEAEEEREMEEGRGEAELLSAATALLICYLLLHLPHLASFSLSPLHLSFRRRKGRNHVS